MRRHRERIKADRCVVPVEISMATIEAMLAAGWITDEQSRSRETLGQVLAEAIADWSRAFGRNA